MGLPFWNTKADRLLNSQQQVSLNCTNCSNEQLDFDTINHFFVLPACLENWVISGGKSIPVILQICSQTGPHTLSHQWIPTQIFPVRLEQGRDVSLPWNADHIWLGTQCFNSYSQIEFSMMLPIISGDRHWLLVDMPPKEGCDIASSTAMRVFGIWKLRDMPPFTWHDKCLVNIKGGCASELNFTWHFWFGLICLWHLSKTRGGQGISTKLLLLVLSHNIKISIWIMSMWFFVEKSRIRHVELSSPWSWVAS